MDVNILFLFFAALFAFSQEADPLILCAKQGRNSECQQIERYGKFRCDEINNNVECILDVKNKIASFGIIEAEEAAIAAPLINDDVIVVGALHPIDRQYNESKFDIVVVTHVTGGPQNIRDVRGKRLCHPGVSALPEATNQMVDEFVDAALKYYEVDGGGGGNSCSMAGGSSSSNTTHERYLRAIAEFFGPSCRPGLWSANPEYDAHLKKNISSLCEQCPNKKCQDNSDDPFKDSLSCLIRGQGDIAITSLDEVQNRMRENQFGSQSDFRFLCKNDARSTLDLPCTWSRQPFPLIIAHRDHAVEVRKMLQEYLQDHILAPERTPFKTNEETQYLKKLLVPRDEKINITSSLSTLSSYFSDFRDIPKEPSAFACGNEVKWCTRSSDEQDKCLWFAQAVRNQGILPGLRCMQHNDRDAHQGCIDAVRDSRADIVTVPIDYGYSARRHNLSAVAYPQTIGDKMKSVVVVNDNRITDKAPKITGFASMQGAKACFARYGGIAWLSWVDHARSLDLLDKKSCNYHSISTEFIGDSCAPGVRDYESNDVKLCNLCQSSSESPTAVNCNADHDNLFYNSSGALKCLDTEVGGGDFAVINFKDVKTIPNADQYRVLCAKTDQLLDLKGLNMNIDKSCYLSEVIDSEVVIRRGDAKHDDIRFLLEQVDDVFSRSMRSPFRVFDRFNHTLHLLFSDATPGLDFEDSKNEHVKNYRRLIQHYDDCVETGASSAILPLKSVLFCMLGFTLFKYL